ncbi:MAG TPA: aminotransferase class I/II-fold pyridoxal phosphate-dependent enzyme [Candidatus Acidoferrum sp.]|nr:aminotransferase class I/II-fold pyridoxal phosphate-dependent enzyme [Candidatus Acidoferrum sp.]
MRRYHIRGKAAKEIAESLELAIDAGRIAAGERLPTIRALAGELGVSPTTVNAAFATLRAHGRIGGNRRGGSVVIGRPAFQTGLVDTPPTSARNLAVANPDPAFLPPLRPIVGAAVSERRLYGEARDSERLLEAARRWFAADGIPAEHLAVVSGALDGVERVLSTQLVAGDTIALEDPTYPPYRELARALGLRVVPVALDERGVRPDSLAAALRARAKAFVVVPRAQNPTGVAFDAPRVRALRRLLDDAPETLVIEDDYLSDLTGVPSASLAGRGRWAQVRSIAKIFGPDLRVALLAGDPLTVARIQDRQRLGCGWVSHLLQDAVAALFRDPAAKRLVRAARKAYGQRREALLDALDTRGIAASGATGFNVWIPVAEEAAVMRGLQEAGWAVDAGERYRAGTPPAIRVTITTLLPPEAERFAADLERIVRPSGRTRGA